MCFLVCLIVDDTLFKNTFLISQKITLHASELSFNFLKLI